MGFTEEFAVEHAAVQGGVILAGDRVQRRRLQAGGDGLELAHPRRTSIAIARIVGEIAGEENQIGMLRGLIEQAHGVVEGGGPQRVRRSVEADVSIA